MGGREAIRGFAVQTLICLLDSLKEENDDWIAVTIEPDSINDKVDILWEFPTLLLAQQVKSSQNQIGVGDVIKWCKELKESQSADRYQLMLAGPIAAAVIKDAPFDGVEVPIPASLNTLALIDQAIIGIERHLSRKDIPTLPLGIRESLINLLSAQLLDGAIRGKCLSRQEFDGWLLRWLVEAYPEAIQRRISANCDVIWSTLELRGPSNISKSFFELGLPITVVNGGKLVAIVEWFLVRVSSENREMIYRPTLINSFDSEDYSTSLNESKPFGEFAVLPNSARKISIIFEPIDKVGLATDRWPAAPHDIELWIKIEGIPEPRRAKQARVIISTDDFSVIGSNKSKFIATSNMEDYLEFLGLPSSP